MLKKLRLSNTMEYYAAIRIMFSKNINESAHGTMFCEKNKI